MALPGLSAGEEADVPEVRATLIQELGPNTEWRFEVGFGDSVDVTLVSGTAELFGTELALSQPYTFSGTKAAIYTWHGAKLEITGSPASDYIADETPMSSYANLHFALETLRSRAAASNTLGPRVMVIGPNNAGKTSLVRLLAAYATRSGQVPVVVNTDPTEGMLTLPGTLSAIALESILDIEDGWGSSPVNGPTMIPAKLPLVYFYGAESADAQPDLYKPLVRRLALAVRNRMEDDPAGKQTGCIIDTPGSISQGKSNYDIIQHLVAEFAVNVLVVLGSERLYSDMTRRFSKGTTGLAEGVTVVKLDKSGGCVDRDAAYMDAFRQAQIKRYFYGDSKTTLSPHRFLLDFDHVQTYSAIENTSMLTALLPGGDPTDELGGESAPASGHSGIDAFERVEPVPQMQHALLAVVQARANDPIDTIRDASVLGFLAVAEVDDKRRKLRVLAPLGGRVPRPVLIWGRWPEVSSEVVG